MSDDSGRTIIKVMLPAFVAVLFLCSSLAHASGSDDLALRWPGKRYIWHYNPENHPTWLSPDDSFKLISQAASRWQACGVELRYAGLTTKAPGAMDGTNVVGWSVEGTDHSAWTSWRARRDGMALEADVTLYSNIYDDDLARGRDARRELYKSIVHEFGHVLGLNHSELLQDAMSVGVKTEPEWILPSLHDITRCRALHPGRPPSAHEHRRL